MTKRIISLALALAMLLSMSMGMVFSASADSELPKYSFKDDFGSDAFGYWTRNYQTGETEEMSWNDTHKMYMRGSTANYINPSYLSVGVNPHVCSMLVFTAPYTGTIKISADAGITNKGKEWSSTYEACYVQIYDNSWSQLARYDLPANNTSVAMNEITLNVTAGQKVRIQVGSNGYLNSYIAWNPEFAYTQIAHEHTWAETWSSDETAHWHECTADYCDVADNAAKNGYGVHTDTNNDKSCDSCGYVIATGDDEALVYSFVSDYQTESADTGVWRYYTRNVNNNNFTPMNYNSSTQRWEAPSGQGLALIWKGGLHTSEVGDYMTVVQFVAPYTGKVTVSFPGGLKVSSGSTDGVQFAFWANNLADQHNGLHNGLVPGQALELQSYTLDVVAGQKMNFLFHSNGSNAGDSVTINPTITYLEAEIEEPDEVDAFYSARDDFGGDVFSYWTRNGNTGEETQMSWIDAHKMYMAGATANYINSYYMSVGVNPQVSSMLVFTAPYTGTITISSEAGITNRGREWSSTYEACAALIYDNEWNLVGNYSLPANNTTVAMDEITMNVTAGQKIRFMASSSGYLNTYIEWVPEIAYNKIVDVAVEEYNISLRDNLSMNFALGISETDLNNTAVNVTIAGDSDSYAAADLSKNADGQYIVSVELAAAQMADKINVQIVTDGIVAVNKDYSVCEYAAYILDDANGYSEKDKVMVEAMLHYGAAAQNYFDYNTGVLANAGYTDAVTEAIPDMTDDYTGLVSGTVSGISFYGASLLFKNKIAVRFYFSAENVNGYTFTVNGKTYTPVKVENGLNYVQINDILPQDLDDTLTVVVADAEGNEIVVTYSALSYIVRQYNKTESEELKNLLQNLYDYHKASLAYIA